MNHNDIRYITELRTFLNGFDVVPGLLNGNAWREFISWLSERDLPNIDKSNLEVLTKLFTEDVEVSHCSLVNRNVNVIDTVFFDRSTSETFRIRYRIDGDKSLYYNREFDHHERINLNLELTTSSGRILLKERVRKFPLESAPTSEDLERHSLHISLETISESQYKDRVLFGLNDSDPTIMGRHQLNVASKIVGGDLTLNYLMLLNKIKAGDAQSVLVELMAVLKGDEKLTDTQIGYIAKKLLTGNYGPGLSQVDSHASKCLSILSRLSDNYLWDLIELTSVDVTDVKCTLFTDIDSLEILLKGRSAEEFDDVISISRIHNVQLGGQQKAFLLQGSLSHLSHPGAARKVLKL